MAKEVDPADLARRYLDLWQDQISALAADPAMAKMLRDLLRTPGGDPAAVPQAPPWDTAAAGQALAAWGDAVSAALGNTQGPTGQEKGRGHDTTAGSASGAAATAAASDDGRGDLDELTDRLAALEKRIAALERKPGAAKPAKPPVRKGPGRASGKSRKHAG